MQHEQRSDACRCQQAMECLRCGDVMKMANPQLSYAKPTATCQLFFFSSRRRHTRWNCDWSSDVCSSDLTLLAHVVSRKLWGWSAALAFTVSGLFLIPECAFVGANVLKIADGGWFPMLIGAIVLLLLTTWKRGREIGRASCRERV